MDKSWMLQYHNRFSQPYIDGVNSFIEFAKATSGGSRVIKCPCNYCCNGFKHDYEIVRDHLLRRGMMVSYDTWLQHGELAQSDESDDSEDELDEDRDEYDELLKDHGRGTYMMDNTSGSRSFQAHSSIIRAQNAGHARPFPDFYDDTHYMHGKKKWINEEAQKTHEELVRLTAEQSQPSIKSPMTDEQISVKVLGQRSGYHKGFGIRKKSTSGSTQNRTGPDSEVLQLRQQVAEFGKRISFLEGLVQQSAERLGIDLGSLVGGDGTSSGAQDATSLDS